MANIIAERSLSRMGPGNELLPYLLNLPMSASTKIWKGALVGASTVVATKGQAVKGGATTAQLILGISEQTVDNSAGSAGALSINVRGGVFKFSNLDSIDLQHVGQPCYASDDQTVALSDNAGARPQAGVVVQVDSDGVWVAVGLGVNPSATLEGAIYLALDLTSAANATLYTFTPQFSGKIKKVTMSVNKAGAGAGATVTITPNIAGTPLTGGVLTPTLGNTTLGAELTATSVTGANMFSAGQSITLVGSSFTAFTAGNGTVVLHLG